ncbi:pyridoxal-phosphate dependent enzyme [Streptomyces sp. RY43-2]|uniref:Pyridoxal-phosphate dependent enzyme n=1 Tax=Streptomyces macrolidinus TaxID=2952607 RepID=A0ABT0ZMG9_9ACTN|nr:pyridoxal-phosphate dependent enzyme [Streptomyces macrolidinus]MCN9244733.1 pyridoxal-phosphate dependent enzyme [Streptomyces macrolidinus]
MTAPVMPLPATVTTGPGRAYAPTPAPTGTGLTHIERALTARRPDRDALEAPFGPLERHATRLLPGLAALRPDIGHTPLVPVPSRDGRGTVWLKAEAANRTGTVKARTAYALLCAAVARTGTPRVRLVEYSGGSLALALAEMCAHLGLDLHLAVPHGSPARLVDTLRRHGARVSHAPEGTGFLGAMNEAARIAEDEDRHLLLQHCAPEAVAMHREHTGAEIIARLTREAVRPVAFAASVGSAGTAVGTTQALRARWTGCTAVAVFPTEAPYGDGRAPGGARRMNGTGGLGHGLKQPLLAPYEGDFAFAEVSYPEALDAMRLLHHTQRIAVSSSAAGAWLSASRVIDQGPRGHHAVAIAASRGTPEEWAHATDR